MKVLFALLIYFSFAPIALAKSEPRLALFQVWASKDQLLKIGKRFEIVRNNPLFSEVIVAEDEKAVFDRLAPNAKLIEADISAAPRKAYKKSRLRETATDALVKYHSFQEVQQTLQKMATKYPQMTELIEFGKSAQKLSLSALRVGKNLRDAVSTKPRLLLTAATHGDEIITTEVLLSLMNTFLEKSQTEPRFQQMLENFELVFIPVLNADGFSRQSRYDNGSDPNRSYPFPDDLNRKPTPSVEAEISFIQKYPIAGSIDFHAYSGVIIYPWGYTDSPLDGTSLKIFEDLTAKMAATNSYGHGSIADIMYIAQGSSCDYFFWKSKSISIGIELGEEKAPDPSEFPKYIQDQEESTWVFIESFKSGPTLKFSGL